MNQTEKPTINIKINEDEKKILQKAEYISLQLINNIFKSLYV